MKLTEKQRAWIDYYKQGHSAAEAARLAGYRGNNHDVIGAQNLAKLSKFITDRDAVLDASRIADMEEINAFWTDTMRDEAAERRDRLKASELRARSLGAFIDRQEITVQATGWYIDDNDVPAT
jgi:phage terminase small subunit